MGNALMALFQQPMALVALGSLHLGLGILGLVAFLVYLTTGTFTHGSYYAGPATIFFFAAPIAAVLVAVAGFMVLLRSFWFGYVPVVLMLIAILVFYGVIIRDESQHVNFSLRRLLLMKEFYLALIYFLTSAVLCVLAWGPMVKR